MIMTVSLNITDMLYFEKEDLHNVILSNTYIYLGPSIWMNLKSRSHSTVVFSGWKMISKLWIWFWCET